MTTPHAAAIFLDYENILYHLINEFSNPPTASEGILELMRNLRRHLGEQMQADVIVLKAYADFEKVPAALSALYLQGIDTQNVLGTTHKNAADMRLCIDLMELLYTRPTIEHYILVAGDRDYIPVVQHLRRQGKKVTVVAFNKTMSGDLLQILGKENFLEAKQFLGDSLLADFEQHKARQPQPIGPRIVGKIDLPAPKPKAGTAGPANTRPAFPERPSYLPKSDPKTLPNELLADDFDAAVAVHSESALDCLGHLLAFAEERRVREVWLSPFLRYLTDKMPQLADYERKNQVKELELAGAIAVEKRQGEPNDFSVIKINYNHPDVVALMP